jgi:hypothetical protein
MTHRLPCYLLTVSGILVPKIPAIPLLPALRIADPTQKT